MADMSILREFAKKHPANVKCNVKLHNADGSTVTLRLVGGDAYSRKEVEQLIAEQVAVKTQAKGTDGHKKDEDNLGNAYELPPGTAHSLYVSSFPAQKKGKERGGIDPALTNGETAK